MRAAHFRSSVFFPLGLVWLGTGLLLAAVAVWQGMRTDALLRSAHPGNATVLKKISTNADVRVGETRWVNKWFVLLGIPPSSPDGKAREVEAEVPQSEFDSVAEGGTLPIYVAAGGAQVWLASGGGPGFAISALLGALAMVGIACGLLALSSAWRRAGRRVLSIEEGEIPAPVDDRESDTVS